MNGRTPEEIHWRDRSPDQAFAPDEVLYYRVPAFNERGQVDAAHIRFPDTSVNRGKYSAPEHLLLANFPKFVEQKVARFVVRDIPPHVSSGDRKRIFGIRLEHDPIRPPQGEENYAHCEIRCFEDGARRNRIPAAAEKYVREILGMRMAREL